MMRTKWIFLLSVPVIVLSLCMASSIHIMSKAEFPLTTTIQGNKEYLEGITIESTIFQNKGAVSIDLMGENISYTYEEGLYQTEQIPPSFETSIIKSSIKGRKELSKKEVEYITSFHSNSTEKVITCYELEQATFKYNWFNIFSPKQNETFTLKSTKNIKLIEEKVQYLYDDYSEEANDTGENYYLYVNDGMSESTIRIDYSDNYLTTSDGNYLITTRFESMVTPSRLYYIDYSNKNKEKIKKIVEFSKDRYPFVMKEVDGKAVVISQDKNKKNYISAYGEDGKLINEKSLPLDLYSNDYMFYYENICINNKYLILEDEDEIHVIDCDNMEVIKNYTIDSSTSITDMYYKDGLLYLIEKVGMTPDVVIKVLDENGVVFEGNWILLNYKKDIKENLRNNIWDYSPSMYYEIEVKR
ncbi:hypothetical protein [Amedibacterium intestinale]|uniref:hypothetical protein n=1 Tax=Amedibacterium intestinale TaxID=2583452 RepID=UPI000E4A2F3D|nr:hypothetical protein [Amedibacterium intestinale]RHO21977.1 hypothetical protein DW220_05840 [Eubacterium sp. AM18-26]RHO27438.1 hypothetical protein DW212_03530 [Eubacterium sp. AM18-10LB-B]